MQKSNNNTFYGVLAVLLVGASFLIAKMWILPQYQKSKTESAQVESERKAAQAKLDSLTKVKGKMTTLSDTVNNMFIAIPKDNDTENIVTALEQIALSNKIYIPTFQISDSSASSVANTDETITVATGNTVDIAFSVTGSMTDLTNFVKAIESDLKFFDVQGISMSSSEGVVSMTLQIRAYKQGVSSSSNS